MFAGISRKGLYPESQSGSNCETLQEVQPLYMLHPTTKLPTTSPLKRGKEIPLNGHTTPFPVVAGHNQLVYAIAGLSMVVACWMLCILYSIVKTRKIEGACETRSLIKNQETQHTSCSDIDALEVPSFNFGKLHSESNKSLGTTSFSLYHIFINLETKYFRMNFKTFLFSLKKKKKLLDPDSLGRFTVVGSVDLSIIRTKSMWLSR